MRYISRKQDPQFDLFISHASEDKAAVARPLAERLQRRGLTVWYDETELQIGDNLRARIDEGIGKSRFAILILSKSFFRKRWTKYELDGLVQLAVTDNLVIFPIWHDITFEEIRAESASIANIVAMSTKSHSVEEIADDIYAVVIRLRVQDPRRMLRESSRPFGDPDE